MAQNEKKISAWTDRMLIMVLVVLMLKTVFTWYVVNATRKEVIESRHKIEFLQTELDSIRAMHRR